MTAIDRIKAMLPEIDDALLEALMEEASEMILAYTRRASVPDALGGALARLTVGLYNRMGTEGETSHSEGGVSRTIEGLPSEIERQLRPWRLAIVPSMHGTVTEDDIIGRLMQ